MAPFTRRGFAEIFLYIKIAQEKTWLEESNLLDGVIKYGLEEVHPRESYDFFRVIRVPLGSLVAVGARSLKIDAASVINEARQREIPRFRYFI